MAAGRQQTAQTESSGATEAQLRQAKPSTAAKDPAARPRRQICTDFTSFNGFNNTSKPTSKCQDQSDAPASGAIKTCETGGVETNGGRGGDTRPSEHGASGDARSR